MIPIKDQDAIAQKFDAELAGPVKIDFFTERNLGITLPGKTPCQYCKPAREMLQEIAGLSDLISLRLHYLEDSPPEKATFGIERVPGIVLRGRTQSYLKFYGLPGGTEFPMFLESIIDISRNEVLLSEESVQSLETIAEEISLRVFVTPTCQYCPAMMRAAFQMAMVSPHVRAETIEVTEFPELAERYQVRAVPLTVIADQVAIPGMVDEKNLVKELMKLAKTRAAVAPAGPQPPAKIERGKERKSGLYIP
ncbi:MAG TPA: thioredoxin family protein [Dehalococcoidia bacterium]|jgi:glutaredoxin-like protein